MDQSFSRQELYDLVWSEPIRTLAPGFGISDVALAKWCQRYDIPQPPRGYWAKIAAGKEVAKVSLPPRGIGMRDIVRVGGFDEWSYYAQPDDLLVRDIPPPPVFAETVEELMERVRTAVGKVTLPRDLSRAHHAILELLESDNVRREKYLAASYRSPFDAPLFDSPFEKRRLRVINALMINLARLGTKPSFRGKDPSYFSVKVGHQDLTLKVDQPKYERTGWRWKDDLAKPANTKLRVEISLRTHLIRTAWEDDGSDRVEGHLADIVVGVIVAGEVQYRQSETSHREWLVERKAQLIEQRRHHAEEQERKERERQATEEKARIDGLLADAKAHRQANDIRQYVEALRQAASASNSEISEERLQKWLEWALEQANRLDPIASQRFGKIF